MTWKISSIFSTVTARIERKKIPPSSYPKRVFSINIPFKADCDFFSKLKLISKKRYIQTRNSIKRGSMEEG